MCFWKTIDDKKNPLNNNNLKKKNSNATTHNKLAAASLSPWGFSSGTPALRWRRSLQGSSASLACGSPAALHPQLSGTRSRTQSFPALTAHASRGEAETHSKKKKSGQFAIVERKDNNEWLDETCKDSQGSTCINNRLSAVLSWYSATPRSISCMEAPCISNGWVLSCHSSDLMPDLSDLNVNSILFLSPGRITPWRRANKLV